MAKEYTPAIEDVRDGYRRARYYLDDDAPEDEPYRSGGPEFDRWLAAHDADVARAAAEKALREAASALDLSAYYPERLSEFHNAEGAAEDWLLTRADRLAGGEA